MFLFVVNVMFSIRCDALFNSFFDFFICLSQMFIDFSHVALDGPDFTFTVLLEGVALTCFPELDEFFNSVQHKPPLFVAEFTVLPKRVKANCKFYLRGE